MSADQGSANGEFKHEAGLCTDCRHAQIINSSHHTMFWLCRLSFVDPRFPKYPPLPVIECQGYEPSRDP